MLAVWRKLTLDLGPLRSSRQLRLLLGSRAITMLGSQVTMVAALVQVAQLTNSTLQVGLLGFAEFVPIVLLSLYGGALGDRVDRRRLALACELGLGLSVGVLVANSALSRPLIAPIFVCAALIAGLTVLQRPSLDAILPRLVAHEQLAATAVLLSVSINFASLAGPALGGILVAGPGAGAAYGLDATTFVVSAGLLWRLAPMHAADERHSGSGIHAEIVEGLRYAWRRDSLRGSYLADIAAMVFAYPYALLPFLAKDLHAEGSVGLLFSAGAAGGLLASATSGWVSRVSHHGRAILIVAASWGIAVGVLGFAPDLSVALACLLLAGAADTLSGVFRDTLWNSTIDDEIRGRLAGVEVLSYATGPPLGQARGGAVADLAGVSTSFWSGGLLCVASIVGIALTHPGLLSFDMRTDKHAAAVRETPRTRSEPA